MIPTPTIPATASTPSAWVVYTSDDAPTPRVLVEFQRETDGLMTLHAIHADRDRSTLDDAELPSYPAIWLYENDTWTCPYRGPISDQAIQAVLENIL